MAAGHFGKALRQLLWMVGSSPAVALTDRQLLERFATTKDEAAFETLVQRHGPLVLGVCRRVLSDEHAAEDAFQATFLLLAHKAGSSFWQDHIGNWLYGVALRLATRARTQAAQRRRRELRAPTMNPRTTEEPRWDDLRPVLDEELARLPEKYRMPLLLCCLQGLSRDAAAQQLGWTVGEVKGRLERGRDLLRARLTRRGLTISAGALPMLLTEGLVAAVPLNLLSSTIQAAAGGAVSASAALLLKGALQAMFWEKMKLASAIVLTVLVLGTGVGFVVVQGGAAMLAPLPQKAQGGGPKGSAPVEKAGLAVAFAPTKAAFASDEVPTFEFAYTNRGDQPFRLYDVGFEVNSWSVVALNHYGLWQAGPYEYDARPRPQSVEVAAGKTHVRVQRLNGPFVWKGEQAKPVLPRQSLLPGKYRVTAKIALGRVLDNNPVPFWTGELTTNPVEFEIQAAAANATLSVKDAATGVTVAVSEDGKALIATDANGKELWKSLVVQPNQALLGKPVIRALRLENGQVFATFGKSSEARVDLKTGKVTFVGSD